MYLFTFRRTYNSEAKWRETPEQEGGWPLIYAVHPTRESIAQDEWKAIVERAGKKDNEYFAQFVEISKQVDETLQKEGLKVSDSQYFPRHMQLSKELGAVPGSMYRALEEVLREEGFEIVNPQNFSYQRPLTDYDKARNAEMAAFEKRLQER